MDSQSKFNEEELKKINLAYQMVNSSDKEMCCLGLVMTLPYLDESDHQWLTRELRLYREGFCTTLVWACTVASLRLQMERAKILSNGSKHTTEVPGNLQERPESRL